MIQNAFAWGILVFNRLQEIAWAIMTWLFVMNAKIIGSLAKGIGKELSAMFVTAYIITSVLLTYAVINYEITFKKAWITIQTDAVIAYKTKQAGIW